MQQQSGYQAGQQQPNKYPRVGPQYMQWGEQPGLLYDWRDDTYYPDPQAEIESGLREPEPEPPGLADTLLPIAGAGAALYGGKAIGESVAKDGLSASLDKITPDLGGLFSGGPAEATQAAQGLSSATSGIGPVASGTEYANALGSAAPAEGGLFSLGGIGSAGNAILPIAGGLGALNLATQDETSPLGGALQGAASGAAIGSGFAGVGAIPGAIGGGLIGLGKGVYDKYFDQPSTKEIQREKWGLLSQGEGPTAGFASGYANDYLPSQQATIDAQYPNTFAGKQESGTLTGQDVWGGRGILEQFGDKWFNELSEAGREAAANKFIQAGILGNSKGDITVTDPAKAQEIFELTKQEGL